MIILLTLASNIVFADNISHNLTISEQISYLESNIYKEISFFNNLNQLKIENIELRTENTEKLIDTKEKNLKIHLTIVEIWIGLFTLLAIIATWIGFNNLKSNYDSKFKNLKEEYANKFNDLKLTNQQEISELTETIKQLNASTYEEPLRKLMTKIGKIEGKLENPRLEIAFLKEALEEKRSLDSNNKTEDGGGKNAFD
jgi:hypothetical protein